MARAIHDALGWVRDTMQMRILSQMFAQNLEGLVLKGGMAMRVSHYRHARATKDIDLDADCDISLSSLQNVVRKSISAASRDGLLQNVVVTEPKQTDTTARWKISGYDPRTRQELHLTVEISRRQHVEATHTHDGWSEDGDRIVVYRDEVIAFQKIKALLCSTREAPRDIADLYLLIQTSVASPVPHLSKWIKEGNIANIEEMWRKIERMDQKMFRDEVLPSLPPTVDGQLMYQDWEYIRLTVGEHVEKWLHEARAEVVGGGIEPVVTSSRSKVA